MAEEERLVNASPGGSEPLGDGGTAQGKQEPTAQDSAEVKKQTEASEARRKSSKVNPFDFEEVRRFQQQKDREIAEARRQAEKVQQQAQEQVEQLQDQIRRLQRQMEFSQKTANLDDYEKAQVEKQFLQQELQEARQRERLARLEIERVRQEMMQQEQQRQQLEEQRRLFIETLTKLGVPKQEIDDSSPEAALESAKRWLVQDNDLDPDSLDASSVPNLATSFAQALREKQTEMKRPPDRVDTGSGKSSGEIERLQKDIQKMRNSGNLYGALRLKRKLEELQQTG